MARWTVFHLREAPTRRPADSSWCTGQEGVGGRSVGTALGCSHPRGESCPCYCLPNIYGHAVFYPRKILPFSWVRGPGHGCAHANNTHSPTSAYPHNPVSVGEHQGRVKLVCFLRLSRNYSSCISWAPGFSEAHLSRDVLASMLCPWEGWISLKL